MSPPPPLHGRSSILVLDAQLCLGAHCPPGGTGLAMRGGAAADPSPQGWDGAGICPQRSAAVGRGSAPRALLPRLELPWRWQLCRAHFASTSVQTPSPARSGLLWCPQVLSLCRWCSEGRGHSSVAAAPIPCPAPQPPAGISPPAPAFPPHCDLLGQEEGCGAPVGAEPCSSPGCCPQPPQDSPIASPRMRCLLHPMLHQLLEGTRLCSALSPHP